MRALVAGVFVGGRSSRMGEPKGLLLTQEGVSIVERTLALLDALDIPAVLVGKHAAYAHIARPTLPDVRPNAGPLGGLAALLAHAGEGMALALACDMPKVSSAALRELARAAPHAMALAPRRDGRWEPLFARYDAPRVLPIARARLDEGQHSLQGLLDEIGASELSLSRARHEELDDWDTPEDVLRDTTSPPRVP